MVYEALNEHADARTEGDDRETRSVTIPKERKILCTTLPDRRSGLNLAVARLKYTAGTTWSTTHEMNMQAFRHKEMIA
jgi:hypothetical protein